jgi:hypothetical protein
MKKILKGFFINVLLLVTLMMKPYIVLATDNVQDFYESSNKNQWYPVSKNELASLRGGFVLPNGIVVDISFDKRIFQNGVMTFSSYFESPANMSLANNGEFNLVADLTDSILQSVIQNNLDDQTLTTINTINVGIKNLNTADLTLSSSEFYTQYVLPNFTP